MTKFHFLKTYLDLLKDDKKYDYEWLLPEGITKSEIAQLEARENILLPQELKELYEFSYIPVLGAYKMLSLPEINITLQELEEIYGSYEKTFILPIIQVIDSGDYIAINPEDTENNKIAILDGFHEYSPDKWETICFGLSDWLRKMVANDFEPFWLTG